MIRDERRINDETVTIPGNSDGSSEASFRDSSGRAQEYERILMILWIFVVETIKFERCIWEK